MIIFYFLRLTLEDYPFSSSHILSSCQYTRLYAMFYIYDNITFMSLPIVSSQNLLMSESSSIAFDTFCSSKICVGRSPYPQKRDGCFWIFIVVLIFIFVSAISLEGSSWYITNLQMIKCPTECQLISWGRI